jgi:hypothetical protein
MQPSAGGFFFLLYTVFSTEAAAFVMQISLFCIEEENHLKMAEKRNWHYKSSSFRGEDCIEEENHLKMAA